MKFYLLHHHKFFKGLPFITRKALTFLWMTIFCNFLGCQFYFVEKNPIATQYSSVSYLNVHKKIFVPKCIACHGHSGGVNLETYQEVVLHLPAIENAVLTAKTMPKNGFLNQNEINLLSSWIKEGALEFPVNPAPEPSPTEPLQPTFSSLQKNIFNVRCTLCHSPGGKAARVPLQTYSDFLQSPREIVLPGNAAESGLILAITRTDPKRMPPPEVAGALQPEEIEIIIKWIEEGATENP